jgi:hypothetical protein
MDCASLWKESHKKHPPCGVCSYPGLWPENLEAYQLFMISRHALVDGFGGVNLANAKIVAEAMGFVWDAFFMRKVLNMALLAVNDLSREDNDREE